MKYLYLVLISFCLFSFTPPHEVHTDDGTETLNEISVASFSLVNDTKEKVRIYTGSGFVSLNKGSKTSITCNTGKEVRWGTDGKKGAVIFKITSEMCGKTVKLSKHL